MNTKCFYEQIKYCESKDLFKNATLFSSVVNLIKEERNSSPIWDVRDAISKINTYDEDKKILLVAPTEMAQELIQVIHSKSKEKIIHLMLIGDIDPHNYFLDHSVALATNDPEQVYEFFKSNKILSPNT